MTELRSALGLCGRLADAALLPGPADILAELGAVGMEGDFLVGRCGRAYEVAREGAVGGAILFDRGALGPAVVGWKGRAEADNFLSSAASSSRSDVIGSSTSIDSSGISEDVSIGSFIDLTSSSIGGMRAKASTRRCAISRKEARDARWDSI